MKIKNRVIVAVCFLALFVMAWSQQGSAQIIDKPSFAWLSTPHQSVTNPDGVVRSKGHALELGKVAMKYLFGADEDMDVELVGLYWIAYTKAPKKSNASLKYVRYYVKINKVNGGVEESGYFP